MYQRRDNPRASGRALQSAPVLIDNAHPIAFAGDSSIDRHGMHTWGSHIRGMAIYYVKSGRYATYDAVAAAICRHMAPDRHRYIARFSYMGVPYSRDAHSD